MAKPFEFIRRHYRSIVPVTGATPNWLASEIIDCWLERGVDTIKIINSAQCITIFGSDGWFDNDYYSPVNLLHHLRLRHRDERTLMMRPEGFAPYFFEWACIFDGKSHSTISLNENHVPSPNYDEKMPFFSFSTKAVDLADLLISEDP